ncbi:alpha-L-fucosidase 1-like [Nicotiana tabacum]|uniref:alpha-L-fucosidase n=2 Tax=Nicotiana TaxID=4085 RepID=A0A1S3YYQ6_TOBAC|nr:PREDICTED: alpha-L-fucosidase 1-like [Nicotiana sylvestris]XP_016457220.1 PREDICTED: alpha-L-fucosidase 1-like [Nicotiana tabacum]
MAKPYNSLSCLIITTFTLLQLIFPSQQVKITPPPLPILPLPNCAQLKWHQRELIMFFHFGVNTFTDREWGTGHENPAIFNPTRLDANQWVDTAVQAGVSLIILTAKHHDGFCLWPSKYTDHSVIRSPWKNGQGDVVQEFVNAAKARGVDVGLYLSPWDRHDKRYGNNKEYNEHYLAQLQELLNNYGDVKEIWFDGAKGSNAPNMTYYFDDWFAMVRELQSTINIFSDAGPGVRWVGNEDGFAGSTSWSTINRTLLSIGNSNADYLNSGDPKGTDWLPPECDVSIRKGWFWHKSQAPKNLSDLLEIYYKSVGRNCVLLLNVPPNKQGLISESDVQRLKEFRSAVDTIFSTNLATKCSIKASSKRGGKNGGFGPENVLDNDHLWTYWAPRDEDKDEHWIEFKAKDKPLRFNVVRIQEAIGLGQRIKGHEIYVDGMKIANGTTIGYKKLHRLEKGMLSGHSVRIKIIESRAIPLISSIGLHFDPFWNPNGQGDSGPF